MSITLTSHAPHSAHHWTQLASFFHGHNFFKRSSLTGGHFGVVGRYESLLYIYILNCDLDFFFIIELEKYSQPSPPQTPHSGLVRGPLTYPHA